MSFELKKSASDAGIIAVLNGKDIHCVATSHAKRMFLEPGKWKAVPVKEEEKGLYVARSIGGSYYLIFGRKPEIEADGDFNRRYHIRSFCWDVFEDVVGIKLKNGEMGKFTLIPEE